MRTLLVGLLIVAASGGVALADKPTKEQLAQAKKLYIAAEAEVRIGKFAEAAKDYTSAYELTKDAALLFKIGSAHQNAGACDSAVPYYRQYLKEASPSPKFVDLTKERITKCGASVLEEPPPAPPPTPEVVTKPEPPPVETKPAEPPAPVGETQPAPPPVTVVDPRKAIPDDTQPGHERDRAWAYAGGAVFLGGAGIVLYAQGRSSGTSAYKDVGYASFGLGGLAAVASVYYFVRKQPHAEETSLIVPTANAHGAGVAAFFKF